MPSYSVSREPQILYYTVLKGSYSVMHHGESKTLKSRKPGFSVLPEPEDDSTLILPDNGYYFPSNRALHPRRLNLQQYHCENLKSHTALFCVSGFVYPDIIFSCLSM